MSTKHFDFVVVGAGIVGAATAYKLQLKFPQQSVALLEKEDTIGKHQTGRNSGVIHSGIYYKPNSFKAKNCREGREQLLDFAQKHTIPHEVCGKIIVATKNDELQALENIYLRGIENQTPDIRYISAEEIQHIEPYITGVKGILVPSAGIIDYVAANKKMADLIQEINSDSQLLLNCQYFGNSIDNGQSVLNTSQGNFSAKKVIFCTGLQSDRTAGIDNAHEDLKIVGFRGDYYEFKRDKQFKINNLVYPVPDPNFPFLGVHFTKMINGTVECGPNAVFTFAREKYSKTAFNAKDTFQALTYSGTWHLFRKFWRKGIDEYRRAFSKNLFVKELQKLMPQLHKNDLIVSKSGIRAQAIDAKGNMIDDFKIVKKGNHIHVLNAPSPAATACLAIADEIVKVVVAD